MDEVDFFLVELGGHQEPRAVSFPGDEAVEGDHMLVAGEYLRKRRPAMNDASGGAMPAVVPQPTRITLTAIDKATSRELTPRA